MRSFELLDIATADMAFVARGKTLEELFRNCGTALTSIMTDERKVKPLSEVKLKAEAHDLPALLFDFLSELLFFKDAEGLVFSEFEVKIKEEGSEYSLEGLARGEEWDRRRHEVRTEVKAATYHQMKVEKDGDGWTAQVVLDT